MTGGQQARAVELVFTKNAVFFGSDTPREINYLYRLDRRSGKTEALREVAGSVFWGRATPDGWTVFSTVVEKSAVNRSPYAELWAAPPEVSAPREQSSAPPEVSAPREQLSAPPEVSAPPGRDEWRCIGRYRKDPFHDRYFDHGQIRFPSGPGEAGAIWLTPYATSGDQRSVRVDLQSEWERAGNDA